MKKVNIEDAVGLCLGHDITEVVPEKKIKRRAFARGYKVTESDLDHLRNLGKNTVYVMDDGDENEIHEDDAALICAPLIAGENVVFNSRPVEGKIDFKAAVHGLFKVDVDRLYQINSLEIPSLPTIHNNSLVSIDEKIAAFRIIPLTCSREIIDTIKKILTKPLIEVKPLILKTAAVVVTGNEVYEGLIKDGFAPMLIKKAKQYGFEVTDSVILPDDREKIAAAVADFTEKNDIVFVTGGTSVDPDDVTFSALEQAGVNFVNKGNPAQPGNNLSIGYKGNTAIFSIPAAALFYRATSLDIFLPRIMAGERISREEIYRAGHGGLCRFCKECRFPICPFGI